MGRRSFPGRCELTTDGSPIFISTGCVSADRVTAPVVRELRARGVDAPMVGLVGEILIEEGVRSIADLNRLSSIGLIGSWSVAAKNLRALQQAHRRLVELFERDRPCLAILVDNPGQNLVVMSVARRFGVPILYYVTPQDVWAAGISPAKRVARGADRIANVFEFEPPYFAKHGGRAEWVGHPLLDILGKVERPSLDGHSIALFPGSRWQEVRDLLPILRETAERLLKQHARLRFMISAASAELHTLLDQAVSEWEVPVEVYNHDPYRVLSRADLLITCSGTATLEATILGLPHIVIYRVHNLVDRVLRPLLVHCEFLAMPNLLAGRAVVPELIGNAATAQGIIRHAEELLGETPAKRRMLDDLAETRAKLGSPGAVARTADIAESLLPSFAV